MLSEHVAHLHAFIIIIYYYYSHILTLFCSIINIINIITFTVIIRDSIVILLLLLILLLSILLLLLVHAVANCDWAKEEKGLGEHLLDRRERTSGFDATCDFYGVQLILEICEKEKITGNGFWLWWDELLDVNFRARKFCLSSFFPLLFFFSFFFFLARRRAAITPRQLTRVAINAVFSFFFFIFFFFSNRETVKGKGGSSFSAKDERCLGKGRD